MSLSLPPPSNPPLLFQHSPSPSTLPSPPSLPPSLSLPLHPPSSYMYAVSMARHINYQVENKRTESCDVTRRCGTVLDIRTAFYLMQELCMPGRLPSNCLHLRKYMYSALFPAYLTPSDTFQDLSSLDRKWLTGLDGAGWPAIVRSCLLLAKEVAQTICIHRTPVFLHGEGGRRGAR